MVRSLLVDTKIQCSTSQQVDYRVTSASIKIRNIEYNMKIQIGMYMMVMETSQVQMALGYILNNLTKLKVV